MGAFGALKVWSPYVGAGGTAPGGAGNGGVDRIAVWQDANTLTSYANFSFDLDTGLFQTPGPMAVGGAPTTDTALRVVNTTVLTGTSQYQIYVDGVFSSVATSGCYGFGINLQTAAAAFTAPFVLNFSAGGIGKGAGSTITRTVNFFGGDQTVGDNNASYADNVAFTGNWLMNFSSTRASSFGGQIRMASLGVGNSAAATTPGSVTAKIEVFNASGVSLGFLAVYNAIT